MLKICTHRQTDKQTLVLTLFIDNIQQTDANISTAVAAASTVSQ